MFLAILKDSTGHKWHELYNAGFEVEGWKRYASDTFSPDVTTEQILEFKVKGKTYKERKSCVADIAVKYSQIFSDTDTCQSYYELCEINAWLELNRKRYGLLNLSEE